MASDQKFSISKLGEVLCDEKAPLKKRFRALFGLKYIGGEEAVEFIEKAFSDSSALLKHELAYCLGQMRDKKAIGCLKQILNDQNQEPMVRHEAGEALGAIGSKEALETLEKYINDPSPEVAETCQLAIKRIDWLSSQDHLIADWEKNPYNTIDPAPPSEKSHSVDELKEFLLNSENSLWDRYRAMFRLRNINTEEAVQALAEGLRCEDSALFRHEIAFVLGQLKSALAVRQLIERLQLKSENCMVRHECAETLGAIGTETCQKTLREFLNDPERVVRESCEVALDISEYDNSNEFQYAGADGYSSNAPMSSDTSNSNSNSGGNYFASVGF